MTYLEPNVLDNQCYQIRRGKKNKKEKRNQNHKEFVSIEKSKCYVKLKIHLIT